MTTTVFSLIKLVTGKINKRSGNYFWQSFFNMLIAISFNVISFEGEVSDFHVDGLSNYSILETDFSLLSFKLSVDFFWPKITGKTNYRVNGMVFDKWPSFGSGNLR